ncbi:MAG: NAD-dependent epimerase/dehydratase family protein [Xanthobacteraceae bacterium]|nr:NAD-dependent epimerase/dehydratase family protein [Xanthobacteraceae bacterium]
MKQALVTGGSGFIGAHLVSQLAQERRVCVLDVHPPVSAPEGVRYVRGSVLDRTAVHAALEGVDEVYHLAALSGMWMPNKADFQAVNYAGTQMVIEAARERGVRRFLHCSTGALLFGRSRRESVITEATATSLDEMPGAYTRSKLLAEQSALQAAAAGLPVVIASPTMPIGPHNGSLTPPNQMLLRFLAQRLQLYLDFTINLVDVRDVAAGLVLAMHRGQVGQRYILGGEDISLSKLLPLMGSISGRQALRIPIPGAVAQTAAVLMEFCADHVTHRLPEATLEAVRIAVRSKPMSIDKSRRELGYAPRPIEQALRDVIGSVGTPVSSAQIDVSSSPC